MRPEQWDKLPPFSVCSASSAKKNGLNTVCENGTLHESMEALMTEQSCQNQNVRAATKTLSPALENYLEIIFLEEAKEGAVRASSIAEAAGVSRSTVTSTLNVLKSMGFVEYAPYSLVHLTEEGRVIGRDIAHRHIVIQEFFQHILQLGPSVSNDVACELEHVIPPAVIRRLGQFVLYLRSREENWKNWQEDYKEIRLEHIQSANADRDLVRNVPPMLAMRTQMMGQDELRKKYR